MAKVVIVVTVNFPHTVLNLANSWSKRPFYADLGTFRIFFLHFNATFNAIFADANFSKTESTLVLFLMPFAGLGTGILNLIINSSTFASPFYSIHAKSGG